MLIVVAICLVLIAATLGMIRRNNRVLRYRRDVLNRISDAAYIDIEHGNPWVWRYTLYDSVSYDEMLYKFWRPLDSFYPNELFADGGSQW